MRKVYLIVALFVLAIGPGLGIFAHRRSQAVCRAGAGLRASAADPLPWLESAGRDVFLRPLLRGGATADALRAFRLRAAAVAGEPISWHLSGEFKQRLKEVVVAEPGSERFLSALRALGGATVGAHCDPPSPNPWHPLFAAAAEYARSRLNEAKIAALSFARDREIFCQSDALIGRLRALISATEEKCARAKKGCPATATAPLRREMEDIEKQKDFNLQKLRRKWPAEVLEELPCSA